MSVDGHRPIAVCAERLGHPDPTAVVRVTAMNASARVMFFVIVAALAGCARIPTDRGFTASADLLTRRGTSAPSAPSGAQDPGALTAAWLTTPLTVDAAQRVALTRNPRLLQQYAALGLAQADVYEAARISNPLFSFSWLDSSSGGTQVALGLAQNMADLLYLSPRKRHAAGALAQTQTLVAATLLNLAAEVEGAYYACVGAAAVAQLRGAIAQAGATSAGLAERFFAAGNIDRQALAREQAAAAEQRIAATRAEIDAFAARVALNKLLGLNANEDHWVLKDALNLPVGTDDTLAEL